jgi:hypothetical protein
MTKTSYKGKHLVGDSLQFQRFSPLSWWEHGIMQADLVLEKPRVLHLDLTAARRLSFYPGRSISKADLKAYPHSDTLPYQSHTYSNKATLPNSTTSSEPIWAISFQTNITSYGGTLHPPSHISQA